MSRKIIAIMGVLSACLLVATSCGANGGATSSVEAQVSSENITGTEERTNVTMEDAIGIFSKTYPNAEVTTTKKEGDAFFIKGKDGDDYCEMKIDSLTGDILFSQKGGPEGHGETEAVPESTAPEPASIAESVPEAVSSTVADTATTGAFTLDSAKEAFSREFPNATIEIARMEDGNAYYVQGWDGNKVCKMKFLSDGSVVLNKSITTGRYR